jgi:competence protein ComEA
VEPLRGIAGGVHRPVAVEDAVGDAVERGPSARVRVAIGAALVLVVVALVASVLITALSPVGATTVFGEGESGAAGSGSTGGGSAVSPSPTGPAPAPPDPGGDAAVGESRAAILVHVLGSVLRPGVYELAEGSRAVDAVAMAGGFAEGAEQASLNLARPLVDGEQLRVLAVGEVPPAPAGGAGGAGAGSPSSGSSGAPSGTAGGSPGALINLNSATALDLDTLPRIGPAMAARIIGWRDENGPFASVDDLLQITGIGDKTFESLRPLVTV